MSGSIPILVGSASHDASSVRVFDREPPLLLEQVCEGRVVSDWILVSMLLLLLFVFATARPRPAAAACGAGAVTHCPSSFTSTRMLLYLSQKLHTTQRAPVRGPST